MWGVATTDEAITGEVSVVNGSRGRRDGGVPFDLLLGLLFYLLRA